VEGNNLDENEIKTSALRMTAVYIPFKTLLTAITSFAQALPIKLDRTAWPSFSNLTQGATLNAFKFLGLVDKDGYVQPILKQLVDENVESARFKSIMAAILKNKYDRVVALANQNGTIAQLQETMREYNVSGTTLVRAVRFWKEASMFSGIPYPPNWNKVRGVSVTGKRRMGSPEGEHSEQLQVNKSNEGNTGSDQGYVKTVTLQGGIGKVTLSVNINPIELTGKSRAWFYELVDKLNECPIDRENLSNTV